MAQVGIVWVTRPTELADAIEKYGEKVLVAVAAVAGRFATILANDARQAAPWVDRTGNARSGLFGTSEADFANHVVTIYLSHGPNINYGLWLELVHSGKNAIIVKTIETHLPELHSMLQEIFG